MGLRSWILAIIALAMIVAAILTWGSLGSGVLIFCLILMAASLLHQHFLINQDEDDFRQDD